MPHALAFDTLVYANKLKKAGFTEKQAEIQTEALAEIVDNNLATKHDLKELEVALKHDIKELEVALKHDIKELEVALKRDIIEVKRDVKELELRLIIKLGTLMTIAIGVVATLVKLL